MLYCYLGYLPVSVPRRSPHDSWYRLDGYDDGWTDLSQVITYLKILECHWNILLYRVKKSINPV